MAGNEFRFEGEWGGRWVVDLAAQLGRGAFGVVCRGRGNDDTQVAVKILLPREGETDIRARTREVQIAERLRDEDTRYLVRTFDYLFDQNKLYVVMELGSGRLEISEDGLDEEEAIAVIRQIAKGLAELDAYKLIHRDLKPDNIINIGGVWKLADFGISRNTAVDTQTVTFADWGTLSYMAPERFEPGTPASTKTDLYALGCIAYELLVGEKFATGEEAEIVAAHRTKVPVLPETLHPVLRSTVLSLMEKDPARRPARADDVLARLQRVRVTESPVLGRIQQVEAQVARRVAEHEASERAAEESEQRRRDAAAQAIADLQAVVRDAFAGIESAASAVSLRDGFDRPDPAVFISMGDMGLAIWLWGTRVTSGLEDDNVVTAGEIRVGFIDSDEPHYVIGTRAGDVRWVPSDSVLIANVAAEEEDGQVSWFVYRFSRNALAQTYNVDPTPKTEPHGFSEHYFLDRLNRQYMRTNAMHIWTTQKDELTLELLQDLFAGGMEYLSGQR